jgi:hypothetical protein
VQTLLSPIAARHVTIPSLNRENSFLLPLAAYGYVTGNKPVRRH